MSLESALALIESVKDYKCLFVGDDIIDEYHYVHPLGAAAKEYLIPTFFIRKEVFDGGVVAAAKHASSFCNVELCKSPTAIRKVRFVDHRSMRKLHEVHYDEVVARNSYFAGEYDAFVVNDFGHGRISKEMVAELSAKPFVAVTAQTNSSNRGFNLITKYPRADYIVIDEPEARLAAADQDGHIEDVVHKLAHGRCERFVVTHGHYGSYGYDHGRFFIHHPALSGGYFVKDTMGAGDAFFAVTALMAKTGSMEDLLLIGSAAGALKCGIIGHQKSVDKESLVKFIKENYKEIEKCA